MSDDTTRKLDRIARNHRILSLVTVAFFLAGAVAALTLAEFRWWAPPLFVLLFSATYRAGNRLHDDAIRKMDDAAGQ